MTSPFASGGVIPGSAHDDSDSVPAMLDRGSVGPVPQAARVLLRVEYADGQVRELEVHHPHSFECKIEHPELPMPLTGDPLAMPPVEATSVRLRFKASRDACCGPGCPGGHYRHPIVLRHEAAVNPAASGG
jgi:hypothetical protein